MEASKKKKGHDSRIPLAKIKKIMQSNKEIGKISQTTPFVIAKSLELFLEDLADSTSSLVKQRSEGKVTPALIKSIIDSTPKYNFLKESVAEFSPLGRPNSRKRELNLNQTKPSEDTPKPLGKLPLIQDLEPLKKQLPPPERSESDDVDLE